jgi:antitoxin VapB
MSAFLPEECPMAISIKDPDTDALARRLASLTGEKITDAVRIALQERVDREEQCRNKATLAELKALVEEYHRLTVIDPRTPDEIIGYDDLGLPA